MSTQTLHQEIEATARAIATIAGYEGSASAKVRPAPAVEAQASGGLERILACKLPVDLRRRLEKLRKRLEARQPDAPRPDLGRDLSQLVDPLLSAGWAETLLAQSLAALSGVGPKRAESFARRGLERISALLFWLPGRSGREDRPRAASPALRRCGKLA